MNSTEIKGISHKDEITKLQNLLKQLDSGSTFFKNIWHSKKSKKNNKNSKKGSVYQTLQQMAKSDIDIAIALSLQVKPDKDGKKGPHKNVLKDVINYALRLEHDDLVAKPDQKATQANM